MAQICMNMALQRAFEQSVPASRVHVARVEVFEEMAAAEPHWRALERQTALATPYQRFDFLSLWQRHVGAAAGVMPFIVVGFDAAGEPMFVWPLGRRRRFGVRAIEFLGGKHANFNMSIWRRDVAAGISEQDIRGVIAHFAGRADALILANQSLNWQGATNPFTLLPNQRSANFGFSGSLAINFGDLLRARTNAAMRKKMRKKERALASFADIGYERARDAGEVRRVLDAFFKQKSARMGKLGINDAFSDPGVRRFVEAAAISGLDRDQPVIELYALSVGDIIVATMGGIVSDDRFCAMFNSIIDGRFAVESPGEQLILNLVRTCCERGLSTFDLGAGSAHYKSLFCDDAEPLFDNYLPLSRAGHVAVWLARHMAAVKRAIKGQAWLWSTIRAARKLRARLAFSN